MMGTALDMRERKQQLDYDDMMDAIYHHASEKEGLPPERDPSFIIVTHEQFASLVQLRDSIRMLYLQPPSRRDCSATFAGVPLSIAEPAPCRGAARPEVTW